VAVVSLTRRLLDTVVVGGRPPMRGLRRIFLITLMGLVVQFVLGMVLNLYVRIPLSVSRAGFIREVETAPLAVTLHAVLGTLLICAGVIAVVRAVRTARYMLTGMAGLTVAGLCAMMGAFAEGEMYVKDGRGSTSLTMAVLTGVALACYINALARTVVVPPQPDPGQVSRTHPGPGQTGTAPIPRQTPPPGTVIPRQARTP
jgi:hypothetical protein